jgi:hypothetical protein
LAIVPQSVLGPVALSARDLGGKRFELVAPEMTEVVEPSVDFL